MKKILLIGGLGEIVRNLNECLVDEFQVQLCPSQVENVQAMVKIIRPAMLIYCKIGDDENPAVSKWVRENCDRIPVLVITTEPDWRENKKQYEQEHVAVMVRPVRKTELMEVCYRLTGMEGSYTDVADIEIKGGLQQKKTILLVDDSALMLRSLKAMLESYYEIRLAKSGKQALKMLEKEKPDLILLDYEMEGIDGRMMFEMMRADDALKDIPVVFLTSVANRQAIYSVLKSKPDGYILKPPDEKRIRKTIEEVLAKGKEEADL